MLTRLRAAALLTLLLLALALPTAAQSTDDTPSPFDLARLAPTNTMLYASIRTDPGFVETLDGLIGRVSLATGFPVNNALGSALSSEGVREWLGDSAALFMLPLVDIDSDPSDLIAMVAEITDRDAAVAFFTGIYGDPLVLPNGYTFFSTGGGITITDDLLVIGQGQAVNTIQLQPGNGSLLDSARFQRAIDAMPAGDAYAGFVYFDVRPVVVAAGPEVFENFGPVDVAALGEWLGVFGMGIAQLDPNTYAVDIGWSAGEGSPFAALYLTEVPLPQPAPIDLAFLANVPADAQFVLQGAGAWSNLKASVEATATLTNELRTRFIMNGMFPFDANPLFFFPTQFLNAFTLLATQGSLALSDEELSSALDGDVVMAMRLTSTGSPSTDDLTYLFEPGVWAASRDGGSAALLEGVTALIAEFGAEVTPTADGFGFTLPEDASAFDSGYIFYQLARGYEWQATDALTYFGADSLTLEGRETLVAVPRVSERIESVRPYLLEPATGFGWLDMAGIGAQLGVAEPSYEMVTAPFDSLFVSSYQDPSGAAVRIAFRLR